jgi:ubiquinone biosynthesis protein COQ9
MPDEEPSTIIDESAILHAAMDLAASMCWERCSLANIAAALGVEEAVLQEIHREKTSILKALSARIDREALAEADPEEISDIPIRERLLELLMLRFDAMQPFKAGIISVGRAALRCPGLGLGGGLALEHSMRSTLEAAGLSASGIAGSIRTKALAVIFLDALRVWTGDDSPDLSATFRRLDERLNQAESLALTMGIARSRDAGT